MGTYVGRHVLFIRTPSRSSVMFRGWGCVGPVLWMYPSRPLCAAALRLDLLGRPSIKASARAALVLHQLFFRGGVCFPLISPFRFRFSSYVRARVFIFSTSLLPLPNPPTHPHPLLSHLPLSLRCFLQTSKLVIVSFARFSTVDPSQNLRTNYVLYLRIYMYMCV